MALAAGAAQAACRGDVGGADCFVQGGGARLHVVAYGGQGPPLILLAGLNNTARIFDDLAPRLTARHTVYAFTRRGFGRSRADAGATYDNMSLVADIIAAMDALHLIRADVVGHSIAGGELTSLAAHHPERVRRLVYLDAAYDRRAVGSFAAADPAEPRTPTADVSANLIALTQWKSAAMGLSSFALASDLRETFSNPTSVATVRAVSAGDRAALPDYAALAAPALALYAPKMRPEGVPPDATMARRKASLDYSIANARPWMLEEKRRFDGAIRCGLSAEVPGAGHYFFLERPAATAAVIDAFLSTSSPCVDQAVTVRLTRSAARP